MAGSAFENPGVAVQAFAESVAGQRRSEEVNARLDEAISAFRRAAQRAPDTPQIQYALGMSLKDKGDSDGGKAALERAEALQRANK